VKRLIPIGILFGLAAAMPAQTTMAQKPDVRKKPKDNSVIAVVTLDPVILEHVKLVGSWKHVEPEEYDAYYHLLAHVRRIDERQMKVAARELQKKRRAAYPQLQKNPDIEFPAFVDLFHNAKWYRGKPVTLKGHVRSFVEQPAGKNEHGIETLYEAWLYTDDSQTHPAVVVCTSIPDDFPKNESLIDHVSATGYFFKQFLYEAQDGKWRLAPLILAHRLEWHPEDAATVLGPAPAAVYFCTAVAFVAILLLLWRSARKDRAYHQDRINHDETVLVDPNTASDPQTDAAADRPPAS